MKKDPNYALCEKTLWMNAATVTTTFIGLKAYESFLNILLILRLVVNEYCLSLLSSCLYPVS